MLLQDKKKLVLYHGSTFRVDKPELRPYDSQKDFGQGFYLTTDKEQAISFTRNKMAVNGVNIGYVNQYVIESFDGLKVLEFADADEQWIKFILRNQNLESHYSYDVVIGKIADDNARKVIRDYRRRMYAREAAATGRSQEEILISNLHPERLKRQVCMHTQNAIDRLIFLKAIVERGR